MRLIDADAVRKEHCEGCGNYIQEGCKTDPVCASLLWINDAPTIDTVPVVRCKDCVRWIRNRGITDSQNGHCFYLDAEMNGHDFCSYGERREGDGG